MDTIETDLWIIGAGLLFAFGLGFLAGRLEWRGRVKREAKRRRGVRSLWSLPRDELALLLHFAMTGSRKL